MTKRIDMTKGPIMKNVLLFAFPLILGNLLQQLYTTVDTLVIGTFCGAESLAAVGTSAQPIEVVLCLFLGIGTAASILMSQYIGAQNKDGMVRIASTAITFVYLTGVPLSVIGMALTPFLLKVLAVPADVWTPALLYTSLVFLGTLGNIGYNINAGLLRGMGDSRASLWFLIVSAIVNVVLDVTLVAGFKLDVVGAAIATSTAMFLSWFFSIYYIRHKFPELKFTILPHHFAKKEMKDLFFIGFPLGCSSSLFAFGHTALQIFINTQGSVFMAGSSIAGRINGLSNVAIAALSSAIVAFSGQNYGAKNWTRMKKGHLLIPIISGACSLSCGLVFLTFRMPLLRLFSKDEIVLLYASRFVVVMVLSYWCYAIFDGISKVVNGIGAMRYTFVINLLMLWAVRVPSAYIITKYFDGTYVMLCYPISFAFGMIMMLFYYAFSPKWKEIIYLAK